LVEWVDDIIVSIDGDEALHDSIRNVPGAFNKICEGVHYIKSIEADYKITARTVIHKLNYQFWDLIVDSAKQIGVDQISFLPADVSSHAFNREVLWNNERQNEILIPKEGLPQLQDMINYLVENRKSAFANHFIAESPQKIQKIYDYYAALHGLNPFPFKKCNAPWVSTVIEANGTVRPCFFHHALGNIHENNLENILNSEKAIHFRKSLDISANSICAKCVCHLNLPATANAAR
jgi:MoaA/NifB/PqqE/SkfB family radical SAM enzyme